jgi:CheY-like chemotaxis protein
MKLMIVDDNKDVRMFLRSLFEDIAEEIIECSDGLSAVRDYEKHRPDYVLMDIEMKRMDGLKATEIIIKENPAAKIIIVTSHNNPNLKNAAKLLGAAAFVSKDNLLELEEIINKY